MAYDVSSGYAAPGTSNFQDADAALPMFNIERVSLQFSVASDFVAAAVANNVLVLALSTGRILRIDLDSPADIDGALYTARLPVELHAYSPQISICPRKLLKSVSSSACSLIRPRRTSSSPPPSPRTSTCIPSRGLPRLSLD